MTQGVGYEHGILKHVDLVLRVFRDHRSNTLLPVYPASSLQQSF